jgi:hypothetical protein
MARRGLGGNERFPGTRDSFHRSVECSEEQFAANWERAFGKKATADESREEHSAYEKPKPGTYYDE